MSYCTNCGTHIPDGQNVCPSCGCYKTVNNTGSENSTEQQYRYENRSGRDTGPYDEKQDVSGRSDYYESEEEADALSNRAMSIICYIGPMLVIPLIFRRDSDFCRFHINQGLILFLMELLVEAISKIPVIGWILAVVGGAAVVVNFVCGLLNAANGRKKRMPILGGFNLI